MTLLKDILDLDDLVRGIDEGFIKHRFDADLGLNILNYTDYAQVNPRAWENPAVRACRGLIYVGGSEDRVVARPWAKFFNHGQKEAAPIRLDERVAVMDKMDGSLGIIHGGLDGTVAHVATRGSLTSDQAIHATEWLQARPDIIENRAALESCTPLVEIIYPENRIVCDYGTRDELVLLGAVHIDSGFTFSASQAQALLGWAGSVAYQFPARTLGEALAMPPREGAEGLVVLSLEQAQALVKIKQDDYVVLHRIVTGLNERAVWQMMVDGKFLSDILEPLPDELHEWTTRVYDDILHQAALLAEEARFTHLAILALCGSVDVSRKEYAELAKQHTRIRPYLFMLLDGKDPWGAILKSLKPAGESRPYKRGAA